MLFKQNYGEKIILEDANTIIEEYEFLKKHIKSKVDPQINNNYSKSDDLYDRTDMLISNKKNAFFFDKDTVLDFFNNHQKAKYLAVVLGAHPRHEEIKGKMSSIQKEKFKPGSFTVVLTACEEEPKYEKTLKVINAKKPAIEYPPGKVIFKLRKNDGFFFFSEEAYNKFLEVDK